MHASKSLRTPLVTSKPFRHVFTLDVVACRPGALIADTGAALLPTNFGLLQGFGP
jgi:hypothetical protein